MKSFQKLSSVAAFSAVFGVAICVSGHFSSAKAHRADRVTDEKNLAQEIFNTMIQVHGVKPAFRPVHAKGVVGIGSFTSSREAAALSSAAHLQGASVPVIVRFSDGATDPTIADTSPDAGPRGMAIRFTLPSGAETDIVAMSHNGFLISNGEEFLELQKSIVATDPSKPHPWPVEQFIASHPPALKFVVDNRTVPQSFATESFFANDAFVLVNKSGVKQAVRYQILPVAGQHDLTDAEAKTKPPNFLIDDLKARLTKQPVKYRLMAQIPNATDTTNDPSLVWPADRKMVELGIISITALDTGSDETQKALAFDPTNLTDGIELSDDELPALRSKVYALSVKRRQAK